MMTSRCRSGGLRGGAAARKASWTCVGGDALDVLESGPRVEWWEKEGSPDLDRERLPQR